MGFGKQGIMDGYTKYDECATRDCIRQKKTLKYKSHQSANPFSEFAGIIGDSLGLSEVAYNFIMGNKEAYFAGVEKAANMKYSSYAKLLAPCLPVDLGGKVEDNTEIGDCVAELNIPAM